MNHLTPGPSDPRIDVVPYNFGDVVRPMSGDLQRAHPLERVVATCCARLHGSGFTGLVYAEHGRTSLVVSVRDGHPVFVEDLGERLLIPDMLLEHGLVTKEQYAEIAARVIETLAENEDIAFCEQAIERGRADAEPRSTPRSSDACAAA